MRGPYRVPGNRGILAPLAAGLALLVHGNVFISLAATSVAVTTILLVERTPDPVALFIVFAATMFVYSVNNVTDLAEDERNVPARAAFTRKYGRHFLALGVVLYLVAVGVAVVWGLPRAEFLLLPVVVTVLYSLFRVKRVLLVKNLLVGVAWGTIPLGVGVYYGVLRTVEIVFLAAFFTVMLTVAAAVFDVKDVSGDRTSGIRTVPVVFGVGTTRRLAAAVTCAATAGVVVAVSLGVVPGEFLVLLGFLAYVCAYVPFATPDRGPLYYGFLVDGEHVFLALLVLVTV